MPRARTLPFALLLPIPLWIALGPCAAQLQSGTPEAVPVSLRKLTQHAGLVFAGTVTRIQHDAQKDGSPAVQITFRVDQGIRGVQSKRVLTIREWAGLWTFGPRYRVGEHLALFLYPPGKLGLTSPVGGAMGRLTVDDQNRILTPAGWMQPGAPSPKSTATPRPFDPNQKEVPHPSPSAVTAPLRLTYRQFARLVKQAAER